MIIAPVTDLYPGRAIKPGEELLLDYGSVLLII